MSEYVTRHVFRAGDAVPGWVCRVRPRWLSFTFMQTVTVEYDSATRHVDVMPSTGDESMVHVGANAPEYKGRVHLIGAPGKTMWHPLLPSLVDKNQSEQFTVLP